MITFNDFYLSLKPIHWIFVFFLLKLFVAYYVSNKWRKIDLIISFFQQFAPWLNGSCLFWFRSFFLRGVWFIRTFLEDFRLTSVRFLSLILPRCFFWWCLFLMIFFLALIRICLICFILSCESFILSWVIFGLVWSGICCLWFIARSWWGSWVFKWSVGGFYVWGSEVNFPWSTFDFCGYLSFFE